MPISLFYTDAKLRPIRLSLQLTIKFSTSPALQNCPACILHFRDIVAIGYVKRALRQIRKQNCVYSDKRVLKFRRET